MVEVVLASFYSSKLRMGRGFCKLQTVDMLHMDDLRNDKIHSKATVQVFPWAVDL